MHSQERYRTPFRAVTAIATLSRSFRRNLTEIEGDIYSSAALHPANNVVVGESSREDRWEDDELAEIVDWRDASVVVGRTEVQAEEAQGRIQDTPER